MRKSKGFTLIEFLIIVCVIGIIAAIAIPAIRKATHAKNHPPQRITMVEGQMVRSRVDYHEGQIVAIHRNEDGEVLYDVRFATHNSDNPYVIIKDMRGFELLK